MSIQISGPVVPPDGSVTAAKINSGAATVGFVLTANGAAGATFAELPAAGGGILATGATVGATSQAQVFTNGVGIGVESPATALQVATTLTTSPRGIMSSQHSTGTDGARFHMRKSRGTNVAPTVIVTGDVLGRLVASGHDGTAYLEMGGIDIVSTGTIGTNRVPTEIRFLTATDAAPSVLTQRMVIDNAGNVGIGTTAPGYPLQVRRPGGVGSLGISINNVMSEFGRDTSYYAIGDATNDTTGHAWYVRSGTATDNFAMGINNLGNVGIGTPSPTAALHLPASSTARASLRIPAGTAPTIPNAGDVWAEGAVLKFFDGTTTKEIAFV